MPKVVEADGVGETRLVEEGLERAAEDVVALLVDDQPAVRRGLRMRLALEPDLEVVGEAGGAAEAITLTSTLDPTYRTLRHIFFLREVILHRADGHARFKEERTIIEAHVPSGRLSLQSGHG